jgi:hypothetical protein
MQRRNGGCYRVPRSGYKVVVLSLRESAAASIAVSENKVRADCELYQGKGWCSAWAKKKADGRSSSKPFARFDT